MVGRRVMAGSWVADGHRAVAGQQGGGGSVAAARADGQLQHSTGQAGPGWNLCSQAGSRRRTRCAGLHTAEQPSWHLRFVVPHPVPLPPQVLEAALDLLLVLAAADADVLLACCRLGFIPAVLRFALPSTPIDLRLQVGGWVPRTGCLPALGRRAPLARPSQKLHW